MGGGIGMGNTCKPMAVSFQCMTKFTTNKKKSEKKVKYVSNNTGYLIIIGCHKRIKITYNHRYSQVKVACLNMLSKNI